MAINDNQSKKEQNFSIYLRSQKIWVPVSENVYRESTKHISYYRQSQQRCGKCICPRKKWWFCDMDCEACKYKVAGNQLSLDYIYQSDEGQDFNMLEFLEADILPFEDAVDNQFIAGDIIEHLQTVAPLALKVASMRLNGLSDTDIANKLGIHRTTMSISTMYVVLGSTAQRAIRLVALVETLKTLLA